MYFIFFIHYDYLSYNNKMYLKSFCDEASSETSNQSSNSEINSKSESGQNPNFGPEQDPDDDDFVKKTVNNNNLITIEHKHKLTEKYMLNSSDLNYSTASPIYNFLKDRNTLLK